MSSLPHSGLALTIALVLNGIFDTSLPEVNSIETQTSMGYIGTLTWHMT